MRCRRPQQSLFRLAIIDGFAGGGRYQCGSPGSPLIFIEELVRANSTVNLSRIDQGLPPVSFQCLLIVNDFDPEVINILRENVSPLVARIKETNQNINLQVKFLTSPFEKAFIEIEKILNSEKYTNVVFNLDQCGHSLVEVDTVKKIVSSYPSAEIFFTFAIQSLIAFLQKSDPSKLIRYGVGKEELAVLNGPLNREEWLGLAERIVFETFSKFAGFVSPFSIHNPNGWRYWLLHMANRSFRARQVFNDVLHRNKNMQAHFGRSGLNMLAYNPDNDANALYLFGEEDRKAATEELIYDIPRFVTDSGSEMPLSDFYRQVYNGTPAHSDDIHAAIIESSEVQAVTRHGGVRRKGTSIRAEDVLKLKPQRSFFPMLAKKNKKP